MSVLSLVFGSLILLPLWELSSSTVYVLLCILVPSLTSKSEMRFPAFAALRVCGGSSSKCIALVALRGWGGILAGLRRLKGVTNGSRSLRTCTLR